MIVFFEMKKNRPAPRRVRAESSGPGSERILMFKRSFFIEWIAKKNLDK
jgi:hypothetical protein